MNKTNQLCINIFCYLDLFSMENLKENNELLFSRKKLPLFERIFVQSFLIFNNKLLNKIILFFLISFNIWLVLFLTFENDSLPGSLYFSLFTLLISSQIFGFIFEKAKLPPLLGIKYNHVIAIQNFVAPIPKTPKGKKRLKLLYEENLLGSEIYSLSTDQQKFLINNQLKEEKIVNRYDKNKKKFFFAPCHFNWNQVRRIWKKFDVVFIQSSNVKLTINKCRVNNEQKE
ncbi:hypothetical protein BpHYR1_014210 [Brachionus plicatilis]|uniref:Uncharacterized protein n=1 Tax=Brachionus plicatilis TaxID=10195 RepID=A0A3M7R4X9_BRAPC|nr:hypothetical protein BpHYR1_014210 [Brachionus plicatilis]